MLYADRVILLDPMNKDGYGLKAVFMHRRGKTIFNEYYLKSVELDPDWNWTNLLLGIEYFEKNDYQNGLHYINESLKGEGRHGLAHLYLGYIFHTVLELPEVL